jgi:hypothetical protein
MHDVLEAVFCSCLQHQCPKAYRHIDLSSPPSITTGRISRMQQVMQTLESVTYYRMRLVKSLYDNLGTLAAPSIASFTACDKPRNLSAQCVCPETAGFGSGLTSR